MNKQNLIKTLKINVLSKNTASTGRKLKKFLLNNVGVSNSLIEHTLFCPDNTPNFIRFTFLINGKEEFPKCKNCSENTVWNSNLKLLDFCSIKCASSSKEVREKVKKSTQKKYGVTHIMKSPKYIKNYKEKCLIKYGVDNVSKCNLIKEKKEKKALEKWGVKNISNSQEIKNKKKETSLKNYGVEYPAQNSLIFQKQQNKGYGVKYYKDTKIKFQGSYELYFLEKMEEHNMINDVSNGITISYIHNKKTKSYHIDFQYKKIFIEIKSTWTYNKNGKDKEMELINKAKWNTVRKSGLKLKVLFSKKEIDNFIKILSKLK